MILLTKLWREILIVLLLCSTYGLGKLYWQKPKEIQVPVLTEKLVEVEKLVTKTIIKQPDGTIITKEETKEASKEASKQTAPAIVKLNPYRYSVSMLVKFDYSDNDKKRYVIDVGARIADSPLVAVLSYDITPRTFALGVRYEF